MKKYFYIVDFKVFKFSIVDAKFEPMRFERDEPMHGYPTEDVDNRRKLCRIFFFCKKSKIQSLKIAVLIRFLPHVSSTSNSSDNFHHAGRFIFAPKRKSSD